MRFLLFFPMENSRQTPTPYFLSTYSKIHCNNRYEIVFDMLMPRLKGGYGGRKCLNFLKENSANHQQKVTEFRKKKNKKKNNKKKSYIFFLLS